MEMRTQQGIVPADQHVPVLRVRDCHMLVEAGGNVHLRTHAHLPAHGKLATEQVGSHGGMRRHHGRGVVCPPVMAFREQRDGGDMPHGQCLPEVLLGKTAADIRHIVAGMEVQMHLSERQVSHARLPSPRASNSRT